MIKGAICTYCRISKDGKHTTYCPKSPSKKRGAPHYWTTEEIIEARSRPKPINCGPLTLAVSQKNGDFWTIAIYFNEKSSLFASDNSDQYMGSINMPKQMFEVIRDAN